MKYLKFLFFFVVFPFVTMAQTSLQSLDWMLGEWQYSNQSMVFTEAWEYSTDSMLFVGMGIAYKNEKIVSQEEIRIEMIDGVLHYIVTVKDHNENKAIPFRLTNATKNSVTFENPEHDFPQKIEYTLINKDSIHAVVSSSSKEKIRKLEFHFSRIQHLRQGHN